MGMALQDLQNVREVILKQMSHFICKPELLGNALDVDQYAFQNVIVENPNEMILLIAWISFFVRLNLWRTEWRLRLAMAPTSSNAMRLIGVAIYRRPIIYVKLVRIVIGFI